ncbi:glycosyltransferase [Rhodococcoides kyotonense]|uniref:glycosyltransferase n=1 Tax=Rhodococcoides kyotonense TaxID=398843 RepID=UPI001595667A|nr:nucleotide disphospho-sugar-binding domain-containing protein [Rhodococcus kyotonensis]
MTNLDSAFPSRGSLNGARRAQFDLEHIFIRPIAEQSKAIDEITDRESIDVVVVETMFFGAVPLLLRPSTSRPRVVALGSNPLSLPGYGRPPAGLGWPPARSWLGRFRNSAVNAAVRTLVLRSLQHTAQDTVGSELPVSILDWLTLVDDIVQLTVPGFEYPLPESYAAKVHFVGPVSVSDVDTQPLPSWWDDLDTRRPTFLVTQGSAERDLSQLIRPTIDALADREVNVVVALGTDASGLEQPLPGNVFLADALPYDAVFPALSGFITNGGYGGVGFAIRHGVPVIAVGRSQDKADVVARVQWSGIGIGIARQTVEPSRIQKAVEQLQRDGRFSSHAAELQRQASSSSGMHGAVQRILFGIGSVRV